MVVFEFFGDSNVAKAWKAVATELERLKGSVLRQTTSQASLRDSLKTVGQTTRFIIVAALSNPVSRLKFEGASMLGQSVTDLLGEIYDYLLQTVNNNPELKVSSHVPMLTKICIYRVFSQTVRFCYLYLGVCRSSTSSMPTLLVCQQLFNHHCQFCHRLSPLSRQYHTTPCLWLYSQQL